MHFFAALNKKGKEASWARLQAMEQPQPNVVASNIAFRGVQITKKVKTTIAPPKAGEQPAEPAAPKVTTSFEASVGDHALFSDDQAVIESLITRLQAAGPSSDSQLLKSPAYQRAQRFRTEGPLLDMFLKIPDLSQLPIPAAAQTGMDAAAVVRELHPERLQGLWFSAGMGRDRMLVRGALLGDTTTGSLFDLIGGNVTDFQTLALAPVSDSYGAFRLDLPALYATVLRAVKAGMPPDRGAAASMMIDGLVMAQTGMRTADLFTMLSGEIAVAGTSASGELPALLMLPVNNSEQLLTLLRRFAGPLFANEEKVRNATVVKIDLPGAPAADGTPGGQPLVLAVSPKTLLVSPDRAQVEGVLTREAAGGAAPAGSLAADATFRAVRKTLPAELNGISYTDVSRMRWDAYIESAKKKLAEQRLKGMAEADRVEKGDEENKPDPARAAQMRIKTEEASSFAQIMIDILPLMSKHLKISAGGSWKASDGVFFDSYVN